jgi:hypothetical protein
MSNERYPLWCIDVGDASVDRFIGPFASEAHARSRLERLQGQTVATSFLIRRCRPTGDRHTYGASLGSFAVVQTYVCEGDE